MQTSVISGKRHRAMAPNRKTEDHDTKPATPGPWLGFRNSIQQLLKIPTAETARFPHVPPPFNRSRRLGIAQIDGRIYGCRNRAKKSKSMIADLCYLSENYKNFAHFIVSEKEPEKR
jgi:hypothetical protein